jgi:hypothetical protein
VDLGCGEPHRVAVVEVDTPLLDPAPERPGVVQQGPDRDVGRLGGLCLHEHDESVADPETEVVVHAVDLHGAEGDYFQVAERGVGVLGM